MNDGMVWMHFPRVVYFVQIQMDVRTTCYGFVRRKKKVGAVLGRSLSLYSVRIHRVHKLQRRNYFSVLAIVSPTQKFIAVHCCVVCTVQRNYGVVGRK